MDPKVTMDRAKLYKVQVRQSILGRQATIKPLPVPVYVTGQMMVYRDCVPSVRIHNM